MERGLPARSPEQRAIGRIYPRATGPSGLRAGSARPALLCGALALCPVVGAGCAGRAAQAGGQTSRPTLGRRVSDPQETLRRYQHLLEDDRPQAAAAAYALLDADVQARLALPAFQAQWAELREERHAQGRALRETAEAPTLRGLLLLDSGVRIALCGQAGQGELRLCDTELRSARPRTPLEALRLFLRAAELRDLSALLRVLAPAQRQRLEEELGERLGQLRRALGALGNGARPTTPGAALPSLEEEGDRARLRYDPRFFVDLRRESDAWWVVDLN